MLYFINYSFIHSGSYPSNWLRNWVVWQWLRDYFPVDLVKTAELDSKKNYIFGCHPHGIVGLAAFVNFATEATGFSRLFPGISPHLCTLKGNFSVPFRREFIMALGNPTNKRIPLILFTITMALR